MEQERVAEPLAIAVPAGHRLDPLGCLAAWLLGCLIMAFIDSAAALVVFNTTAFRIPSRWVLIIRAARTIGSSLLRDASAVHASHAFRAQPMRT